MTKSSYCLDVERTGLNKQEVKVTELSMIVYSYSKKTDISQCVFHQDINKGNLEALTLSHLSKASLTSTNANIEEKHLSTVLRKVKKKCRELKTFVPIGMQYHIFVTEKTA